jgi:preprotein translocase subunit SecE
VVSVALLAGIGCYRLYQKLVAVVDITETAGLWITVVVPIVALLAVAAFLYWLVNKPTVADFLISAEGELKKVSFSSKKEITVSTFVVIAVVFLMTAMLGMADFCFNLFFSSVLGI